MFSVILTPNPPGRPVARRDVPGFRVILCPVGPSTRRFPIVCTALHSSDHSSDRLSACRLPGAVSGLSGPKSMHVFFLWDLNGNPRGSPWGSKRKFLCSPEVGSVFSTQDFLQTRGLKTEAVSRVLDLHPTPKIFLENPLVGSG